MESSLYALDLGQLLSVLESCEAWTVAEYALQQQGDTWERGDKQVFRTKANKKKVLTGEAIASREAMLVSVWRTFAATSAKSERKLGALTESVRHYLAKKVSPKTNEMGDSLKREAREIGVPWEKLVEMATPKKAKKTIKKAKKKVSARKK